MKKALLVTILASPLLFFGCSQDKKSSVGNPEKQDSTMVSEKTEVKTKQASYADISPTEAKEKIEKNPSLVIIDVSPAYEKGHLPGAINYYLGDGSLDKAISELNKEFDYLVYCHSDSASIAGAEKLSKSGFENVFRLKGNYSAWVDLGYPVEIPLKAVDGSNSSGVAVRSNFDGFKHSVETEIPDPAPTKFYEGWLVKKGPALVFFSTGELKKNAGKYQLEYSNQEDQGSFNEVVITEETKANGLDGKPEKHILEGAF